MILVVISTFRYEQFWLGAQKIFWDRLIENIQFNEFLRENNITYSNGDMWCNFSFQKPWKIEEVVTINSVSINSKIFQDLLGFAEKCKQITDICFYAITDCGLEPFKTISLIEAKYILQDEGLRGILKLNSMAINP